MQNYLFKYNDEEYITLFGIGYMNKLVDKTINLPDGVISAARSNLDVMATLEDIKVSTDLQGHCTVVAKVLSRGKTYIMDTNNTINPVREVVEKEEKMPTSFPELVHEEVAPSVESEILEPVHEEVVSSIVPEEPEVPKDETVPERDERTETQVGAPTAEELTVLAKFGITPESLKTTPTNPFTHHAESRIPPLTESANADVESIEETDMSEEIAMEQEFERHKQEVIEAREEAKPVIKPQSLMKEEPLPKQSTMEVETPVQEPVLPKHNPVLLQKIDEYSVTPVDMNEVASKGDDYCETHKWKKVDNMYMIDDVINVVRCVHSDVLGIHMTIPYVEVANYGKDR